MGRSGAVRGARWFACIVLLALSSWGAVAARTAAPTAAQEAVRVPILTYHGVDYSGSSTSVTPEQLAEQCGWLVKNGYTTITLGQFWDASLGYATLPPNPIILTNDDGWPSALTFADILGQYGLVGTYFINNTSPLTPDQIRSLAARGSVEAHTVSHADLTGLNYDAQFAEISGNKSYLEQVTGVPVRFMAWPFGASNESAAQAAAAAGIVAAFGLGGMAAYLGTDQPYHIPRISVSIEMDLTTFADAIARW